MNLTLCNVCTKDVGDKLQLVMPNNDPKADERNKSMIITILPQHEVGKDYHVCKFCIISAIKESKFIIEVK